MKAFIFLSFGIGLALATPIVYTGPIPIIGTDPIPIISTDPIPIRSAPVQYDPIIPIPVSYRKPALLPPEDLPSGILADPPTILVIGNTNGRNFMEELPDSKIVGGTKASITEVPYQLKLTVIARNGSQYQCGASIVNSKWALTAAHCFSGFELQSVRVHAGYTDFNQKTGGEYDLWADTLKVHGNWNPETLNSDIALLRVSGTFQTNARSSKAVQLVGAGQRPTGNALASGWGATQENNPPTNALMKVTLPVLADTECQKAYGGGYDSNVMMCAGFTNGSKDTCQGDSGGPLVLNGVQIGIVSFGYGCARQGYPGVYTRVATFRQWIDNNTPQ